MIIGIWHIAATVAALGAVASLGALSLAIRRRDTFHTYHHSYMVAVFSVTLALASSLIGSN